MVGGKLVSGSSLLEYKPWLSAHLKICEGQVLRLKRQLCNPFPNHRTHNLLQVLPTNVIGAHFGKLDDQHMGFMHRPGGNTAGTEENGQQPRSEETQLSALRKRRQEVTRSYWPDF